MTYGEKAVAPFGLLDSSTMRQVNELYAKIIDICDTLRKDAGQGEKARLLSVAITEAQGAQMWAVKAVAFPD
jgi:hypothetical protein